MVKITIEELQRRYRSLTIRDSFMFTAVFSDPLLLAKLLALILPEEILDPDDIVIKEMEIKSAYGSRAVRFDVYRKDNSHLFDVEMQTESQEFLFDRAMYNLTAMVQSMVRPDSRTDYELKLKSYVIFICDYDVNHGRRMTHYSMKDADGNTGSDKFNIILIGCHAKENDSPQLKAFTDYVRDPSGTYDDVFVREIENRVQLKRMDPESERVYMDWQFELNRAERAGLKKGEEIGLKKGEEIGLKKGEEIGLKKGEGKGRREERKAMISAMMTKLKAKGYSNEDVLKIIAEMTGLPAEETERILSGTGSC